MEVAPPEPERPSLPGVGPRHGPIVIDHPTRITDRGIESLSRLPILESPGLAHSPDITDDGLACLGTTKTLRELDPRHCSKLTPEGLNRLEQALPDCRIGR